MRISYIVSSCYKFDISKYLFEKSKSPRAETAGAHVLQDLSVKDAQLDLQNPFHATLRPVEFLLPHLKSSHQVVRGFPVDNHMVVGEIFDFLDEVILVQLKVTRLNGFPGRGWNEGGLRRRRVDLKLELSLAVTPV